MTSATREPLSWLTLELYALDELPPRERRRVETQLALSAEDRACLAQIVADRSELPPLPAILPARSRRTRRLGLLASALAAALALTLVVLREDAQLTHTRRVSDGVKGGEVSLLLHGESSGHAPRSFAQGERFKALATCPPWFRAPLALLVFQGGERYAPLGRARALACGNHVPLAGAFSLEGTQPAIVCLTWSPAAESAREPSELGAQSVCSTLVPQ